MWALRDGLEESHEKENDRGIRDAYVMAAAQYILCYGQSFFRSLLLEGSNRSGPNEVKAWSPGPLYSGKAALSIDRWRFWRDRFKVYASLAQEPDRSRIGPCSEECQCLAQKAAEMMDILERCLSF